MKRCIHTTKIAHLFAALWMVENWILISLASNDFSWFFVKTNRFSRPRNSNLSWIFLETLLVSREPIKIDIFRKWFPVGNFTWKVRIWVPFPPETLLVSRKPIEIEVSVKWFPMDVSSGWLRMWAPLAYISHCLVRNQRKSSLLENDLLEETRVGELESDLHF